MKETERRKRFFQVALQLIHEKGFKAMTIPWRNSDHRDW